MIAPTLKSLALSAYPLRAGRKKLVRWLFTRWPGPILAADRHGTACLLDGRNYIDSEILRHGAYEGPVIDAFCAAVERHRCDLFLDVGANIGIYSLAVARRTACREVVCFEPDPRNRNQLAANLFLNRLDDIVTVRPEAASDAPGRATFHAQRDPDALSSGRSRLAPIEGQRTTQFDVALVTLDEAVPVSGRRIAVKMDVEGHEEQALRGMRRLVAENAVYLQVEVFAENRDRVFALLEGMGMARQADLGDENYVFARGMAPPG